MFCFVRLIRMTWMHLVSFALAVELFYAKVFVTDQ
jgi:hypothetical protein